MEQAVARIDGSAYGQRQDCPASASSICSDIGLLPVWLVVRTVGQRGGEDIRYLDRARAGGLPDFDYWLFDSRQVARLHFDEMTYC